ncbi:MAG: dockerin type I repeat-containing protein [Oscillospiraceae bacterium]|nr:dockerin type I repeat-containing protein [Oscillospiraceae bacterium]
MKKRTITGIRLAAGAVVLGILMALPLKDQFFGGNDLTLPVSVYGKAGDTDGNGILDMQDVKIIREISSGLMPGTEQIRQAADLNGDGQITSDDAGILMLYLSDENAKKMTPDVYYQYKKAEEVDQW